MISLDEIRIESSASYTPPEQRPSWLPGDAADLGDRPAIGIRLGDAAFRVVEGQASGSLDEVGGLLVGEVLCWQGRLYVDIEQALAGERTRAGPAHITFTAETWAALLRRKERELPAKRVVGWYHSHPRMGIFLSDLDLSLHRHFFPQAWHVALVINGQDHKAGFFAWSGETIQPVPRFAWSAGEAAGSRFALHLGEHPFGYDRVPARTGTQRAPSRRRKRPLTSGR